MIDNKGEILQATLENSNLHEQRFAYSGINR